MKHVTYTGKLVYLTDGFGEDGREHFTVTVHPNGGRTLRSFVTLDNDALMRDVTYTEDEHGRPRDCFVQLFQNDSFKGNALFRFFPDRVECDSRSVALGHVHQVLKLERPALSFGAHPLITDAWCAMVGERLRGKNKTFHIRDLPIASPEASGGSGPIGALIDITVHHIGVETVTTAAGTFETLHLENWSSRDYPPKPPVIAWLMPDCGIPVRMRWDLVSRTYELVEFNRTEHRVVNPGPHSRVRVAEYVARHGDQHREDQHREAAL